MIQRSLAGPSCTRSTSRAARLAAIPTCAGGRAESTRASTRNNSRDSDGSGRPGGMYVDGGGGGRIAGGLGLVGYWVRASRMCERWSKRLFRSLSAMLAI